jgi:hypothetical protein
MALKHRYPKIMLVGTGFAFIVSGIDCQQNNLMAIAISSYVVGLINMVAVLFLTRHPFFIKILLLLLNAVFAFLSSYIYFSVGKDKIQYGWMVVGIVNLVAIAVAYRKRSKIKRDTLPQP